MPSNPSIFDTTNLGGGVGNVEDLSGAAPYLYPSKSPVSSVISVRSTKSFFPDFTIDTPGDPDNVAVGEGEDITNPKDQFSQLGRFQNVVTKRRESFGITDDQELAESVDEVSFAKAEMKAQIVLNVKKELAVISNNTKSTSNALEAEGLFKQLSADSTVVDDDTYRTPAASRGSGTPTESGVNDVIDSIYNVSGEVEELMFFTDTELGSQFAENATRLASTPSNAKLSINIDGKAGYVPMYVKMWEGPHGAIMCKSLNPKTTTDQTNRDTGMFLNPKFLEMRTIGGREVKGPYDFGGGPYGAVQERFCAVATDPRAHGLWTSI
jgi:hypothetical protein